MSPALYVVIDGVAIGIALQELLFGQPAPIPFFIGAAYDDDHAQRFVRTNLGGQFFRDGERLVRPQPGVKFESSHPSRTALILTVGLFIMDLHSVAQVAHPTLAELRENPVVRDGLAGHDVRSLAQALDKVERREVTHVVVAVGLPVVGDLKPPVGEHAGRVGMAQLFP